MQNRMFDTTYIQVNRRPFFQHFLASQFFVIVVIYITQEVPGRTCPLRHCVCFSLRRTAAFRASCVYPFVDVSQRRFTCICRFVGFYLRQQYGQLIFRNSYSAAVFAVNDGNRFAPISLSGEYPVTQFIVNGLFAQTFFFHNMRNLFFCFESFHTIPVAGVDDHTVTCVSFCQLFFFFAFRQDYLNDRQIEFLSKFKVTFVMSRYTHYGTSTIVSQYIVCNPNGDFFAIYRVYAVSACEYTSFFFVGHTINGRFCGCIKAVFFNRSSSSLSAYAVIFSIH